MTIENHFLHDNQEGDFPGLMVTTQTVDPATPGTNRAIFYVRGDTKDVKIRLSDGTYIFLAQAGDSDAPADAKYLIQTADAELPNAQAMGALATGLVVNTTTTGVQSVVNTSAGLAGVISDETGSGALVFGTNPTIAAERITGASDTQQEIVKGYSTQTSNLVEYQTSVGTIKGSITVGGIATFTSHVSNGTAGAGYIEIANQSSAPGTPTTAGRIYFDNSNRLSWIGTNTYVRTFDGTANTADRIYVLPNQAGTVLLATYTGAVASTGTHTITGSADATQLTVIGNSTQTTVTFDVQNSNGTSQFKVSNAGVITTPGRFVGPVWGPAADSTSALKITQADGSTALMTIDTTNSVWGFGVAPSTANHIGLSRSVTDLSATSRELNTSLTHTITSNNAQGIRGLSVTATVNQGAFNATSAQAAIGNNLSITISGSSGTVTGIVGQISTVQNNGAGVLTSGYSYQVGAPVNNGSGTFTSFAAYTAGNVGGVATNTTLVLLGTQTIATGNFTIDANSSTYASRLGAALTITGSADTTQLVVKGNGTQTTVTFSVQSSGGTAQFTVGNTGNTTWSDGANLIFGTSTGTKFGTATTQKMSWFNATPVVQQTDGAALTNSVTAGGTTDTIANYTDLTLYANDAAAIRNNIYQLARKIKIVDDALRTYGLLS